MSARDIVVVAVLLTMMALGLILSAFMNDTLSEKLYQVKVINDSALARSSIQSTQQLQYRMDYVFFAIFFGFTLAIIVTGWFVSSHPIYSFFYILLILLAVIISPILSNAFETTYTNPTFSSFDVALKFPITLFIMNQLPMFIVIIGFIGVIVMFAKPYLIGGGGGL